MEKILDSELNHHIARSPALEVVAVSSIQTVEEWECCQWHGRSGLVLIIGPWSLRPERLTPRRELIKQTDGLYLTGKHSFQTYIQAKICERKSHEPSGNRFLSKTPGLVILKCIPGKTSVWLNLTILLCPLSTEWYWELLKEVINAYVSVSTLSQTPHYCQDLFLQILVSSLSFSQQ